MLFNTFLFWFFLLAVWVLYTRLEHRQQNWLLLVASYLFYGAWDWRFLGLIWLSTGTDYMVGLAIGSEDRPGRRKGLLLVSLIVNLGLLAFFKYFNFFVAEFASFVSFFGLQGHGPVLEIILPVGISFYTFQTLSYTIDIYRGQLEPTRDLLDFALYVAFFPQLVAGPIERSRRLLPQIQSPRYVNVEDIRLGAYDVLYGLFLKVVVADNMAPIANAVFGPGEFPGGDTLLGVYAFALQIYGDFAGYSFIARGVARWLGVDIMLNFRRPYFAVDPSDFWQRWHISLSSWLRDYLYIPLGGNRGGTLFTYRNLMLTMLLGGLWHGPAWTFVLWGGLHGLMLIGYRAAGIRRKGSPLASVSDGDRTAAAMVLPGLRNKARTVLSALVLFNLVCVTWVFFRAQSIGEAWQVLATIATQFGFTSFALGAASAMAFFAGPLLVYELWLETGGDHARLLKSKWWVRGLVYAYCIFMLLFFPPISSQQFIYFQF